MANGGTGLSTNYQAGQEFSTDALLADDSFENGTAPNWQYGGQVGETGPMSSEGGIMSGGWTGTQQVGEQGPVNNQGMNPYSGNLGFMSPDDARAFGLKSQIPNLALGAIETVGGIAGLSSQGDIPQYGQPDELERLKGEYSQIAERGFPEVNAAYEQRLNRSLNTARQESMDQAGPSSANAINAAFRGQAIEGARNLAEMERQQKMRGLQGEENIARTLQQLEDERTRAARRRYMQEEQAFGGATKTGLENVTNALNLATTAGLAATGNPAALFSAGNQALNLFTK